MANTKNLIKDILFLGDKKQKFISAKAAYSKAKYGKVTTLEELLEIRLKDIEEYILNKCTVGKFSTMIEIDTDLNPCLKTIVDKLKDNGFQVIPITKDTVIKDNEGETSMSNLETNYLLIFWKNVDLATQKEKENTKQNGK